MISNFYINVFCYAGIPSDPYLKVSYFYNNQKKLCSYNITRPSEKDSEVFRSLKTVHGPTILKSLGHFIS